MMSNSSKLNRVLLIDDDNLVNTLNSIIIRESDLVNEVIAVESGEKGLDALKTLQQSNQWPEIIFIDINMPGMNGWEFLEKFKEIFSAEFNKAIVALLSSSLDPDDQKRANKTDLVDFYFSKPLTNSVVEKCFEKYRERSDSLN